MPEISRFYGMVIRMFYDDHNFPHFHVQYGRQRASIGLEPLTLLRSTLPPRAERLALEWAELHLEELMVDWNLARAGEQLNKIEPLR